MISNEEISVVISGPIVCRIEDGRCINLTSMACRSVRDKLPGAEIVFSTWKEEKCEKIDCDILVKSVDPGPNIGNVNRQICSRLAGIKAATHQYVLALRSESYIQSDSFKEYFGVYQEVGTVKFHYLTHRIVIPAAKPVRSGDIFHIGDWYFFGEKGDLIKFWELPYMEDARYGENEDDIVYNPHRYLIVSFVQKFYPLHFLEKKDYTLDNIRMYEQVLAENFVITGFYDFGCRSYKYPQEGNGRLCNKLFHYASSYTFREWKNLYKSYCDNECKVDFNVKEWLVIHTVVYLKILLGKIRRRLGKFRKNICK